MKRKASAPQAINRAPKRTSAFSVVGSRNAAAIAHRESNEDLNMRLQLAAAAQQETARLQAQLEIEQAKLRQLLQVHQLQQNTKAQARKWCETLGLINVASLRQMILDVGASFPALAEIQPRLAAMKKRDICTTLSRAFEDEYKVEVGSLHSILTLAETPQWARNPYNRDLVDLKTAADQWLLSHYGVVYEDLEQAYAAQQHVQAQQQVQQQIRQQQIQQQQAERRAYAQLHQQQAEEKHQHGHGAGMLRELDRLFNKLQQREIQAIEIRFKSPQEVVNPKTHKIDDIDCVVVEPYPEDSNLWKVLFMNSQHRGFLLHDQQVSDDDLRSFVLFHVAERADAIGRLSTW